MTSVAAPSTAAFQHSPYKNVLLPFELVGAGTDKQHLVNCVFPQGTVHAVNLAGHVEFFPFPVLGFTPNEVIESPFDPTVSAHDRLFVGQLPYDIDDSVVQWVASQFGGCTIHAPERIVKHNKTGGAAKAAHQRRPQQAAQPQLTGCLHVYVQPGKSERLMTALNKRILFDRTGVWYASTEDMRAVLGEYCRYLHHNKTNRLAGMPYDTVNIERAVSTFRPRRNSPRPSDDAFAAASVAPFYGAAAAPSRSRTPSPPPMEYYADHYGAGAAPAAAAAPYQFVDPHYMY